MAVKMVHIYNRYSQAERQPFCERCAHQKRAKKPGAAGEGYCRQVVFRDSGAVYGRVDHGYNILLMSAGGQFGHHPSVFLMHALRRDYIGEKDAVADNCG